MSGDGPRRIMWTPLPRCPPKKEYKGFRKTTGHNGVLRQNTNDSENIAGQMELQGNVQRFLKNALQGNIQRILKNYRVKWSYRVKYKGC